MKPFEDILVESFKIPQNPFFIASYKEPVFSLKYLL